MSWRPSRLAEIVGQTRLRERLEALVLAAVMKNDALPHMLLHGPRGTGKTTLARALAAERGVAIVEATGDSVQSKDDVVRLVDMLSIDGYLFNPANDAWEQTGERISPTIVFIDEIHGMSKEATEALYHPLEDRVISLVKSGRIVTGVLPRFTLLGATTDAGKLLTPLTTRMRMMYVEPYTDDELFTIACAHDVHREVQSGVPRVSFSREALWVVASRSQGNPRLLVNNLSELADIAVVQGCCEVTSAEAGQMMERMLGIDGRGLGNLERRLLEALPRRPMGLDALAAQLGETPSNVAAAERYLQEVGAVVRGPRGRELIGMEKSRPEASQAPREATHPSANADTARMADGEADAYRPVLLSRRQSGVDHQDFVGWAIGSIALPSRTLAIAGCVTPYMRDDWVEFGLAPLEETAAKLAAIDGGPTMRIEELAGADWQILVFPLEDDCASAALRVEVQEVPILGSQVSSLTIRLAERNSDGQQSSHHFLGYCTSDWARAICDLSQLETAIVHRRPSVPYELHWGAVGATQALWRFCSCTGALWLNTPDGSTCLARVSGAFSEQGILRTLTISFDHPDCPACGGYMWGRGIACPPCQERLGLT